MAPDRRGVVGSVTNKICLVTGASAGIGLATALELRRAALAEQLLDLNRTLPDRAFDKLATRAIR